MEDQALKKEREGLIAKAVDKFGLTLDVAEQMTIDQLRDSCKEPPKQGEQVELMVMSLADLKGLTAKDLKKLCKEHEMETAGKKPELFNRVFAIRFGRIKRYIGSETRCKVCGAKIMVKGTAREPLKDGRTLITRSIKCHGRNAHRYPLPEIV